MERCLCGLRFAYSRSIRAIEEINDLDGRGVEFKSYSLRTSHVFLYSWSVHKRCIARKPQESLAGTLEMIAKKQPEHYLYVIMEL